MTFIQRLWRYMIGIAIGTMLAFFFFGSRSCTNWLPNPQVRQFLGDPGLMGDERTRCLMQCGAVTMADLRGLLEEGDIQYSKSDVRNEQGNQANSTALSKTAALRNLWSRTRRLWSVHWSCLRRLPLAIVPD